MSDQSELILPSGLVDGRHTPLFGDADLPKPLLALGFRVSGLEPGARTAVVLTDIDSTGPTLGSAYWKYGPPTPEASPTWYEFTTDEETGTGALLTTLDVPQLGLRRSFVLALGDGLRGDTDGAANGTITDPGGPVVFAGNTPEAPIEGPLDPPSGAAGPDAPDGALPATSPPGGSLSRTGTDPTSLLVVAIALLALGSTAVLVGRARRQV